MITIPITYTGLTPSLTEDVEIVSGQRETLAVAFSFSEDWSAYTLRTAMFSSRTATRAQMIEEGGTAVIPSEVIRNGERYVKISAFGTLERADGEIERYNGRAITLRIDIGGDVEESGGCTDVTAYEKLLVRVTALEERVDNLPAGGGGGSSVALDTTLTKPGYAADAKAVGDAIAVQNVAIKKKLDAEKLPAAVETALEEAKESGEFDGPPGQPGEPGTTPHIGENGNWWIGTTDTGTKAQGEPGQPGTTPHIGENGNWWIGTTDTGVKAQGEPGQPGAPGDDYVLTDADKTAIAEEAAGMVGVPEKLPNPNALTFTGAVTGTYDGSEPLTVEIPSGGGGTGGASVELDSTLTEQGKAADAKAVGDALSLKADVTSVPNSATVNADNELVMQHTDGDAVAELFKVALPAGGGVDNLDGYKLIRTITLTEDVAEVNITTDDDGNPISVYEAVVITNCKPASGVQDCYSRITVDSGYVGQVGVSKFYNTSGDTIGYFKLYRVGGRLSAQYQYANSGHYTGNVGGWTRFFDAGRITGIALKTSSALQIMTGSIFKLYARG